MESPAVLRKCKYAFLTLPNYSLIAVANAIEPLRMANRLVGKEVYEWSVMSLDGRAVDASSGLALSPKDLCMESAVAIGIDHFPPVSGEAAVHRPIRIPPPIARVVRFLVILTAFALLMGGISSLLPHHVPVTQTDSGLCKR